MRTYNYKGYEISYQEEAKEWVAFGHEEAIRAKLKRDVIKAINNDVTAKITSREWI